MSCAVVCRVQFIRTHEALSPQPSHEHRPPSKTQINIVPLTPTSTVAPFCCHHPSHTYLLHTFLIVIDTHTNKHNLFSLFLSIFLSPPRYQLSTAFLLLLLLQNAAIRKRPIARDRGGSFTTEPGLISLGPRCYGAQLLRLPYI